MRCIAWLQGWHQRGAMRGGVQWGIHLISAPLSITEWTLPTPLI